MVSHNFVPYPLFNLYVEGDLGIHKGKPVLKQAFYSKQEAEAAMVKCLISGRCAWVRYDKENQQGEELEE